MKLEMGHSAPDSELRVSVVECRGKETAVCKLCAADDIINLHLERHCMCTELRREEARQSLSSVLEHPERVHFLQCINVTLVC